MVAVRAADAGESRSAFWIQPRLPGAVLDRGQHEPDWAALARVLPALFRLNGAQAGLGTGPRRWRSLITQTLASGGDGYYRLGTGCAMLADMVIREATAADWPAIWPILKEAGTAGETLTWDSTRTEARARSGWMRELPGRTIVAVIDDGRVIGSANTHPIHPGPGAHVANAGFVVHPARRGEGAGGARAGPCAGVSLNRHAQTATGRCSSMRLSKPIRRRSGCGVPSAFRSLPRCRRRFVTRHTDTSASISCTSRCETDRRTHFRNAASPRA